MADKTRRLHTTRLVKSGFWALVAGVSLSCAVEPTAPEDAELQEAQSDPIHVLARNVAQLIREPTYRVLIRAQFDSSPYIEDRIRLSELLADTTISLPSDFREQARSSLLSAPRHEIDIYMPVVQHRDTWRGGTSLQVAAPLMRSGDAAVYTPAGRVYRATGSEAPRVATLVVTPTELHYEASEATLKQTAPSQALEALVTLAGTTIHVANLYLYETAESWFRGAPEFEISGIPLFGGSGRCAYLTQGNTGRTFNVNSFISLPTSSVTIIATAVSSGSSIINMKVYEDDGSSGAVCGGNSFRARDAVSASSDGPLDDWMGDGNQPIQTTHPGSSNIFSNKPPLGLALGVWRP